MATTIDQAFVSQFSANIHDLLEQKGSKTMAHVDVEVVTGEKAFFERIGSLEIQDRVSRNETTPTQDAPHSRRMVTMVDRHGAVLLDKTDEIRMLIDPTNNYAMKLAGAMGRKVDDVVFAAAIGTAATGADGSGSQAFDTANQQIAAGGAGLTMAKLITAKKKFLGNDYDGGDLKLFVTEEGIEDLLNDEKATSGDYQAVKALVAGEVNTIMGMQVIFSSRVPLSGSDNQALVWAPEALKLAVGRGLEVRMDERSDQSYSKQIYISKTFGAVRMDEKLVVSILYT